MDNSSLNVLITNLDDPHDSNIPSCALLLIQSMKGLLNELRSFADLLKRIETLEDVNVVR